MFTLEIVLASVFIANPEAKISDEFYNCIKPTLITVAVSGQIIDPREKDIDDKETIRNCQETTKNYPFLDDLNLFPDENYIKTCMKINRNQRNYLTKRLMIDSVHSDLIQDSICYLDQIYQVYSLIGDARREYYYVRVRRESLNQIRTLLGEENYYSGKLPNPIP